VLSSSGQVRCTLKTPYRDGTTHIALEPPDLIARLAALASHSRLRAAVTPAHRGMGKTGQGAHQSTDQPITPRHVAMSWARRLKRVFGIEIESCVRCGGKLEVIASIEEPQVIAKILAHLETVAPDHDRPELPLGPGHRPRRRG
jgi:hypothetical protein